MRTSNAADASCLENGSPAAALAMSLLRSVTSGGPLWLGRRPPGGDAS